MCAMPRRFVLDWLGFATPELVEGAGASSALRVDDLLLCSVTDPGAFAQLPVFATALKDPELTESRTHAGGCACNCCCGDRWTDEAEHNAPTVLVPQYLNQSSTQRWVKLAVEQGRYTRAVEDVYAALGGSMVRCVPVYRRAEVLEGVRFDVLVGRVTGKRRVNLKYLDVLARQLELTLTVHGGGLVRLSGDRPIILSDKLRGRARALGIERLLYERIPLRSRNTLGSRAETEWLRPRPRLPSPPSPRVPSNFGEAVVRSRRGRPRRGGASQEGGEPVPRERGWHFAAIHATEVSAPQATPGATIAPVVVAVIDDTCAVRNSDLGPVVDGGGGVVYERADLSFGTQPNPLFPDPNPQLPIQSHGTGCCGVIVARSDQEPGRSDLPPRGLAPRAQILPVSIHEWTDADDAAAIRRACFVDPANSELPRVRVLSMSLGWVSRESTFFAALEEELYRAHMQGILVVVSTGNVRNPDVTERTLCFPACLPYVMAVGAVASPEDDMMSLEHKEFGDASLEPWAARFDDAVAPVQGGLMGQISVVAPGVGICTTDVWPRKSDDGNPDNDNYTDTFNGTSAATPLVAGLAALLFEKTPALTAAQVRYIIEATAEKVGKEAAESFDGPNGGADDDDTQVEIEDVGDAAYAWRSPWDSSTRTRRLGYGCIHVEHALDFADVHLHDATRSRGGSPLTLGIGASVGWASNDVLLTSQPLAQGAPFETSSGSNLPKWSDGFWVNVRVNNAGPMIARNVVVQAWLIDDPALAWLLKRSADGAFVVSGPDTTGVLPLGLGNGPDQLLPGVVTGVTVVSIAVPARPHGMALEHAYLLVMVHAQNDHAFPKTLPARPTDVLPHNNLARVSLKGLVEGP